MTPVDPRLAGPPLMIVTALFGALFGSFLNVVIHRLPRGESIVFPPSRCPACGARIRPWDNVPVVSWVLLRGRCRDCRAPISPRYPLVEALAAGLALLVAARWGLTSTGVIYFAFCLAMLAILYIDLDHQIIPDAINFPGLLLGLLLVRWTELTWLQALIGAGVGFGTLLAIQVLYEKVTGVAGMGDGDVKMAAFLGSFLGWSGVLLTIFLGSFFGSLYGILSGRGRRAVVPFGTFLAPSAVLVLFAGPAVLRWYWSLVTR